ncbi:glutathione S-transferase N-terminal domain-containing protein [Sphingomonas endolithica]|uniref:glutathione S-transferase N-terminal domain-containing protein n=1 Tax=Sphingomonas endolithica TaxID=2972485 RepID=UPI0021AE64D8|nr:glutathione S-transferase N-terminal domain-containing protein [Sphingomonas sp. ZFBP2030]
MTDLSAYPITKLWQPADPTRIQLYSLPTPNGVKASIMLEETGLAYEPHLVDFAKNDQKSEAFVSLNPNGKIPAMIDPDGPGGEPLALFESGAILLYLAEKTGKFLGQGPADRWHVVQWVMFQMGGVGPMFGQLGFFNKFAGKDWEDKRPLARYVDEAKRLLGVMDAALAGKTWFLGEDYSIADVSMIRWVNNLITFYEARELVRFEDFAHVGAWLERGLARPAVQRGLKIPARA